MSTNLYIGCAAEGHEHVWSDSVGQHLYQLPQIRADIANRAKLVEAYRILDGEVSLIDRDRMTTLHFFVQHPTCPLRIEDEYGFEYLLTDDDPTPFEKLRDFMQTRRVGVSPLVDVLYWADTGEVLSPDQYTRFRSLVKAL
jgi:hypothetical protein